MPGSNIEAAAGSLNFSEQFVKIEDFEQVNSDASIADGSQMVDSPLSYMKSVCHALHRSGP